MDIANKGRGLPVTRADFKSGYTIYVFDLSSDKVPNSDCLGPLRQGVVRLDARFATPLAAAINIIIFAEYISELQIDKYRNVLLNI